jgi:hypothetical protein
MEFYSLVSLPCVDKEPALGLSLYLPTQLSKKAKLKIVRNFFFEFRFSGTLYKIAQRFYEWNLAL